MIPRATARDLRLFLRGRINQGMSRLLNARRAVPVAAPRPLDEALGDAGSPLGLARLLEGRSNPEREAAVAWYLGRKEVAFARQRFATFEGRGENFSVDVGGGDRILVLVAHHDAVPGSPGANDNAAAVGILLELRDRLVAAPPRGLRVRLAFFGDEERGMLGSRQYARHAALDDLVGVVSLELCGIGEALALWDVTPAVERTALVRAWVGALDRLGYRRDVTYHLAPPVPLFGSDHRPFADRGVPAVGLTVIPTAAADALRAFVYGGVRSALRAPARRPPPFATYHTPADRADTLEPATLDRVVDALEAFCRALE